MDELNYPLILMRLPSLLILLTLDACTVKQSGEYQAAAKSNTYLATEMDKRDKELEEITGIMSQIENNLSAIDKNEGIISELRDDDAPQKAKRINTMISEMGAYVEESSEMVEQLDTKLKTSLNQNAGLRQLIETQKRKVIEKEAEIVQLKLAIDSLESVLASTVTAKNNQIKQKRMALQQTQQSIEQKEEAINTAYYTFGSKKELMANEIIKQDSRLLGLKKMISLTEQMDRNQFKRVNATAFKELDIGFTQNQKLITTHPLNSYYFVKTDEHTYLKVTDPQKFWSISKFLVILTEE